MSEPVPSIVKGLFGLGELEDDDFADTIASPLGELLFECLTDSQDTGRRRTGIPKSAPTGSTSFVPLSLLIRAAAPLALSACE